VGSPSFRLLRAAAFAAVCVALSAFAHELMAPAPIRWWAPLAGFGAVAAAGYALAARERSLAGIVVGVEAAEGGLHLLFTSASAPTGAPGLHFIMIDGVPMCSPRAGHEALMSVLPAWAMTGPGMVAAHILAGGLAALWLRRGERAVWRLANLLANLIVRPFRAALSAFTPIASPARPATRVAPEMPTPLAVLRHSLDRRGPPRRTAQICPALP
jgi:hypothetical protein